MILAIVLFAGFASKEQSSVVGEVLDRLTKAEPLIAEIIQEGRRLAERLQAPPVELDRSVDMAAAEAALTTIMVEPEVRRGYQREDWPHWIDADGDCLNTREEVLVSESLEPVRLSPDGCDVVGGLWIDPYTGERYRDPQALDIDHLVPLQEAHDSGGHAWRRARRAAFANDLDDPRTLIAVSRTANRSKGARGPEEWLPPDPGYRCRYVADWVAVKARWRLAMDESERVAVGNILNGCRSQQVIAGN